MSIYSWNIEFLIDVYTKWHKSLMDHFLLIDFTYEDVQDLDEKIANIQELLAELLPTMRQDADEHFYRIRHMANQVRG